MAQLPILAFWAEPWARGFMSWNRPPRGSSAQNSVLTIQWAEFFGSPKIWSSPPLVNTPNTQPPI
jgi:hypothetical protein